MRKFAYQYPDVVLAVVGVLLIGVGLLTRRLSIDWQHSSA